MSDSAPSEPLALVSVICRSMGRPQLNEALASVARQSYGNIQLLLVDAAGNGLDDLAGAFDCTVISLGKQLPRPHAANAGLAACEGEYFLFLDEDDWIAEDHIQTLVRFLEENREFGVCYSSTQRSNVDGELLDEVFNTDFEAAKLRRGNFIPIHSALTRATQLETGVRFDESLEVFEDWDFWLQLSTQTQIAHVDTISAFYRQGGDSDVQVNDEKKLYQRGEKMADARALVLDKWLNRWSGAELNETFGTLDNAKEVSRLHVQLNTSHQELAQLTTKLEQVSQALKESNAQVKESKAHAKELGSQLQQALRENAQTESELTSVQQSYAELLSAHEALDQGVKEVLNSFSWKITAPYRYIKRRLQSLISNTPRSAAADQAIGVEHSLRSGNGDIQFQLRSPSPRQEFVDVLAIEGWLWSDAGVCELQIRIDGSPLSQQDYFSSDLNKLFACTALEDAQRIGFILRVPLQSLDPGLHELDLVAKDEQGRQTQFTLPFVALSGEVHYQQWQKQQQENIRQQLDTQYQEQPQGRIAIVLDHRTEADDRSSNAAEYSQNALTSLKSVLDQSFQNWQCFIWQDKEQHESPALSLIDDPRVSGGTSAIQYLDQLDNTFDYFCILSANEVLDPRGLWEALNSAGTGRDLIYFDHDVITSSGARTSPTYNFSWSPIRFFAQNYIGGFYLLSLPIAKQLIGSSELLDAHTDYRYNLALEASLLANDIKHVAMFAWSKIALERDSNSDELEDCATSADVISFNLECKALETFLQIHHPAAKMTVDKQSFTRRVKWQETEKPLVSIIIPTTGNPKYLQPCIESIEAITSYPNFEFVLLDNGRGQYPEGINFLRDKNIRTIECHQPFNWSQLNNIGFENSQGELLLFLNDDVEIFQADWLEELVSQSLRPGVGVVGNLLLYPNKAIQHAGVFLVDHGGGARHFLLKTLPEQKNFQQLDKITRETSAVTGACLMISRERFVELGQFDEDLPIVGNDIDLCLRAIDAGYRNIWTPHSQLTHHESVSREHHPITDDEKSMWQRWSHYFKQGDKYYHPHLSLEKEDCSLDTRRAARFSAPIANPSAAGINLIAYIRAEMGVGEAARGNAKALAASGIPFGVINFEAGNPAKMNNLSCKKYEIYQPKFDINLIHINADHIHFVQKHLGREYFENSYNIGYWAWELPEFPDKWLSAFKGLDEIWVPSEFVRKAVSVKSPLPVFTIPHVVETPQLRNDPVLQATLPTDKYLFLSMFDINSISERKNPFAAISAFKRAFNQDDETAQLIVKVSNPKYSIVAQLNDAIGDWSNIQIIKAHLDRNQINVLLNSIDCFVSLHRSEGFGLVPAEAMSLGKAVIVTNWSGNLEYTRENNCLAVDYSLVPLGQDYGPYQAHQYWADPNIEQAAEYMAVLAKDPSLNRRLGAAAKETIATRLSAKVVSGLMQSRYDDIRSKM